jgi:micrococcal nuclease
MSKQKISKYLFGLFVTAIVIFFGRGYSSKVVVPHADAEIPPDGMYHVMKVIDGDTIDVSPTGKVADIERIRLIGINTPETVDPRKAVQCFGYEASDETKKMLTDKNIFLRSDPTQTDRDKYGRLLRYVFIDETTNYNQFLVQEGFAHEYTYKYPYQYQSEFKKAQAYAQENKKGLWAECGK